MLLISEIKQFDGSSQGTKYHSLILRKSAKSIVNFDPPAT